MKHAGIIIEIVLSYLSPQPPMSWDLSTAHGYTLLYFVSQDPQTAKVLVSGNVVAKLLKHVKPVFLGMLQ